MKYIITILLFSITTTLCAQTPEQECLFNDALLDNMTGNWTMAGEMGGQKVAYNFNAQWVLNHKFMEWEITDILKSPPAYTAKIYVGYDCKSKQYIVHWIDNMGGKFSETLGYGTKKGDAIEVKFNYPKFPAINTISYDKVKRTWQFHLTFQNENKKWSTWSNTVLERKR